MKKLEKQLRAGKLDAAAQEKLAKQLEQMKEKLEAAAEARQQAMDDLKKQIEQQKKAGQPRQGQRAARKARHNCRSSSSK